MLEYLDFYRAVIRNKLTGLDEADLRTTWVPAGWTTVELRKHVVNVERRRMVWGFEGVDLDDPWGEDREDRWYASPDESAADLLTALSTPAAGIPARWSRPTTSATAGRRATGGTADCRRPSSASCCTS